MTEVKRAGIRSKISQNPFKPDLLYLRKYTYDNGSEEIGDRKEIQNFRKPVRIFLNEKLERSLYNDTMLSVESVYFIMSEFDCELEKGMIFKYLDGKYYEVVMPEKRIQYGNIIYWISELSEYSDADNF